MKYFIKYRGYNIFHELQTEDSAFVNTKDLEDWWDGFTTDMKVRYYFLKLTEVVPLPELP